MNDLFIPLGGANEIGASCYYLQLDMQTVLPQRYFLDVEAIRIFQIEE